MEQTLGKRIMQHRKRLGMTQDALAEKLNITAQAVSKWENDLSCPDISTLPKLAEIFGITTDELLGREAPVHQAEVVNEESGDHDRGIHIHFNRKEQEDNVVVKWDSGRKYSVAFAVWMLATGGLYLVAKLGNWDVGFWSILWPLFFVIYGIVGSFTGFSALNLGASILGAYFLVRNMGWWQLEEAEGVIFPVCLLLFGISLLVEALRKPKKIRSHTTKQEENQRTKFDCTTTGDRFDCNLAFGEKRYMVERETLAGGSAEVAFGTLVVDLTKCQQLHPSCRISAECAFGKLILQVPSRFRVEHDDDTAFGTVAIHGYPDAEPIATLLVDADVSFGEICIEYI